MIKYHDNFKINRMKINYKFLLFWSLVVFPFINLMADTINIRGVNVPLSALNQNQIIVKLQATSKNLRRELAIDKATQNILLDSKYGNDFLEIAPLVEADARRSIKSFQSNDIQRYSLVSLKYGSESLEILNYLQSQTEVQLAYFAPRPAEPPRFDIPPTTPKFERRQKYLNAAPVGMGVKYANRKRGGKGKDIKVVDIEYQWLIKHEDLKLSSRSYILNSPINIHGKDHGTAVAGIINARKNKYGIRGIASQSTLLLAKPFNSSEVYSIPTALNVAVANTNPGDIILIEQQYYGGTAPCRCSGDCDMFVPVDFYPAEFDAIKAATDAGRIVIEAAGNGSQNLDDPVFTGIFSAGSPRSGAIMVAAVSSDTREGLCFSNAGSRIDLSAWGERVMTTGYGDRFDPLVGQSGRKKQQYTAYFSGTSSASALIAGASASLQGFAKANGGILTADQMLAIFRSTGTITADEANFELVPDLKAAIEQMIATRGL